ncbi:cysteine hydrolase family protein [Desulfopila aestuarii]|uniref:Nicotinamidase-related amidase n=1 Tax=Desulfopila aestuarii DSM 18488 TaxID=1121416 RepID=A0A1M7YFG0_9BACT|nr:cysteine hydrolase family protein [Desulfopila aestuarii]SHO51321.1 Nicotinamidase-related amidase [Desulfopila aestuarii DSM 18488]
MNNTALIIIDVQNDYFQGGRMALPGAEEAAANIRQVLESFRENKLPVIHIQHVSLRENSTFFLPETEGVKIHQLVEPAAGEKVIVKHWPNSFRETEFLEYLQQEGIEHLVISGMMTFMCVDATTRAALDLGFGCTLLHDCTAAPPAEFAGVSCSAEQVRAAVTSALALLCDRVLSSEEMVALL